MSSPLTSPLLLPAPPSTSPSLSSARTPHHTLTLQTISRSATAPLRRRSKKWQRYGILLGITIGLVFLTIFHKTTPTSLTYTVNILTYIGDASFSISGAATAGDSGADVVGCVLIGCITALGGGTARDILLDNLPISWLQSYGELVLCTLLSLVVFLVWAPARLKLRISADDEWLFWTDTLGLGVFAASGAHKGDIKGANALGCIVCGLMTATFGGLVRDILCGHPPRILYAHRELYALPAVLGASLYIILIQFSDNEVWTIDSILYGTWFAMAMRVVAFNHFIVMPTFSTAWWRCGCCKSDTTKLFSEETGENDEESSMGNSEGLRARRSSTNNSKRIRRCRTESESIRLTLPHEVPLPTEKSSGK